VQKALLFSLIFLLSVFNSCSNKQVEALQENTLPCYFVEFSLVLPASSYEKASSQGLFSYSIGIIKNADSIIKNFFI